ncbi:DUF4251 domain-containing protein [Croceivirga thetidis]|uniref:DUF4251 domain-containing protein n=1 Tax=Croceivirga thetidis TaxID=2721623 RepID=A0ABX1GQW7_9FLAO|nr:DUF4251 domain-containing protein [Croceivirga thetidis]NKI32330.1 DUF4251 domain-containing protein [Croceivirga thetidis]
MMRAILVVLVVALTSCAGSKKAITAEQMMELEGFVRSGDFTFEAQWAFPRMSNGMVAVSNAGLLMPNSNAGRIDLLGNTNFITFENDSINTYLPYFGERQMGGTYGNQNVGIQFKGLPEDLIIKPNAKNTGILVAFTGLDGTESYQVTMDVFPNKKSYVTVNSSHRFPIGYSGSVRDNSKSKDTAETIFD